MDRLTAETIGTSCSITAISLAWFLALDIFGIDLGIALLGWLALSPILLYVLLRRLTAVVARRTETDLELTTSYRIHSALNYITGQAEPPLKTIIDCCDRLIDRCRAGDIDIGRVNQEADAIRYEVFHVRNALSRPSRGGAAAAREQELNDHSVSANPSDVDRQHGMDGHARQAAGLGKK
jgi:hypothetical protein